MEKQIRLKKPEQPRREEQRQEPIVTPPKSLAAARGRIVGSMDAVIDSIDKTLEENAEEFVRNFVQRGGE
jgi:ubiquitin-like protein Pup